MVTKSIDYKLCTSCMECERICTNSRVIEKNAQGQPFFKNEQRCIACGHCLAVCPQGAISFSHPAVEGLAHTYYAEALKRDPGTKYSEAEAFDLICSARSARLFLDEPVEREQMAKVLDAMARAPSAGNEQNRKFYILQDKAKLGQIEDALWAYFRKASALYRNPVFMSLFSVFGAVSMGKGAGSSAVPALPFRDRRRVFRSLLSGGLPDRASGFTYLKNAPVLVVVARARKGSALHKAFYRGDANIAVAYGTLMANALGLASCFMGLLEIAANRDPAIRALIGMQGKERVDAACVFGCSGTRWHQIPLHGPVNAIWQ